MRKLERLQVVHLDHGSLHAAGGQAGSVLRELHGLDVGGVRAEVVDGLQRERVEERDLTGRVLVGQETGVGAVQRTARVGQVDGVQQLHVGNVVYEQLVGQLDGHTAATQQHALHRSRVAELADHGALLGVEHGHTRARGVHGRDERRRKEHGQARAAARRAVALRKRVAVEDARAARVEARQARGVLVEKSRHLFGR